MCPAMVFEMDKAVETVLAEYDQRGAQEFKLRDHMSENEWMSHRDDFLVSIGRNTGQIFNILIKGPKARNILKIGTSYRHSTVWLAAAAGATGGKVVRIDEKANKQKYAREMIARAGLAAQVEFRLGDAHEMIATLPRPSDFVPVDLWKAREREIQALIYGR